MGNRRFNDTGRGIGRICAAIGHSGWSAVVAAGLCGVASGAFSPPLAAAEEPSDEATDASSDSSVLIATREDANESTSSISPVEESNGSSLEPISQVAEHTPDLAEPSAARADGKTSKFGDALAEVARNDKPAHSSNSTTGSDLGAAYRQGVAAEAAKFNDIQPGASTKADVISAWDQPTRTTDTHDGQVLTYHIEPFKVVDVLISGETVSAIKIELQGCLPPKRLAKQLSLDKIDAVTVNDEQGKALGQAYPERGVLFLFAPAAEGTKATADVSQALVTHVVIQPLDANAFALRAENRLHGPYEQNLRDLQYALSLNPNLANVHWLLADVYLATGQADRAEAEAGEAKDTEPQNAAYSLRHAQALRALGRYDEATHGIRALLDRENTPPIVKAQALHEMAQLASLGDAAIASKAISFDTKAIEIADSLANSKNVKERRAAKQLLVEAHLDVAREIAGHGFNNKVESVSQWIGRASGLAEDFIANDGGSLELRLLVAKEALGALASFKPSRDPEAWVGEAKQAADSLAQQYDDDLWQRQIKWELGQAYFYAVRIEHVRLQSAAALRYGQLAIENLADGAETRQAVYDSERMVGELYFQIGAVYAVHKQDHKTAIQWYDKALPLLTAPRPVSELLTPQRDGEELVSMGVSYWQSGEKDRAVDLTLGGAELVQRAVDDGILAKSALAVPYSNLSTMYQQLGENGDAAKYAELAKLAKSGATEETKTTIATPTAKRNDSSSQPRTITSDRPNGGPSAQAGKTVQYQSARDAAHRSRPQPTTQSSPQQLSSGPSQMR